MNNYPPGIPAPQTPADAARGSVAPQCEAPRRTIHYVGFRDDRYLNALRVFGGPRIIHRWWDKRARREIGPDDVVVFADGELAQEPRQFNAPDIDEDDE